MMAIELANICFNYPDRPNDPVLNIDWGLKTLPNISEKDSLGTSFLNAEK